MVYKQNHKSLSVCVLNIKILDNILNVEISQLILLCPFTNISIPNLLKKKFIL